MGWVVAAVAIAFLVFLVVRSRVDFAKLGKPKPKPAPKPTADSREKLVELKKRARTAPAKSDRAAAWREAAELAANDLGRPELVSAYALRALRINQDDVAALELLVGAWTKSGKLGLLERQLWRRLKGERGPGYERAYDALLTLYEGPLNRREAADALRAMRANSLPPPPLD
jgi:hypothetical protein